MTRSERTKGDLFLKEIAFFLVTRSGFLTGSGQWLCSWKTSRGDKLHLHHVLSLRAFWTLRDFELNLLTLFESFEAVALNGAVVNENVR